MAVNKVDYEVLETGVTTYGNNSDALDEVLTSLMNMNSQLEEGWTNDTATAFIERFNEEYKPALENARDAIQSISDYISKYVQNRQDDDAQAAAAIRA